MNDLTLFWISVAVYSAFPFYFTTQKNPLRAVSFYVYLGLVLTVGGFLGAICTYAINSVNVSAGNLAYGGLMMTTILLVIVERNMDTVRNVIRLVITVNVFVFFLFELLYFSLNRSQALNPFNTSAAVFNVSLWIMLLGEVLIIFELLLLLFIFERIKAKVTNVFWLSLLYIIFFVSVLCLDGILFPVIAFGIKPEMVGIVIGNVKGKFIMASAFSVPMFIFLLTFHKKLSQFIEEPLFLKDLLSAPREKLVEEIQRQKQSLLLSEEKYQHLAESIDDIFFSMDANLRYTYWNKASEKTGLTATEALGKSLYDIFPQTKNTPLDAFYKEVLNSGKPGQFVNQIELQNEVQYFDIAAYPFKDGISVIARNITERIQAENQIKTSLREKEVLLQELYHRTKNNMQVIGSMLSLQADSLEDEAVKSIFIDTQNRIQSMALVHQKLYQSHDLSNINLQEYIYDLVALLFGSYKVNTNKISLNFNLEAIFVLIDIAIPCGLVLNELISNSLKYAFPGDNRGELTIRLGRPSPETIELYVADNGVGMPPGFDFRVNGGLGTQIILGIVEHQLGGQITFETNRGGVGCLIHFKDQLYNQRV